MEEGQRVRARAVRAPRADAPPQTHTTAPTPKTDTTPPQPTNNPHTPKTPRCHPPVAEPVCVLEEVAEGVTEGDVLMLGE